MSLLVLNRRRNVDCDVRADVNDLSSVVNVYTEHNIIVTVSVNAIIQLKFVNSLDRYTQTLNETFCKFKNLTQYWFSHNYSRNLSSYYYYCTTHLWIFIQLLNWISKFFLFYFIIIRLLRRRINLLQIE